MKRRAHLRPIVTIMLNNAKLAFIRLEQQAKGLPDWGTDLIQALQEALAQDGPALLDVMVDPDALIMPPKIDLAQAARFGLSRLRDALGT